MPRDIAAAAAHAGYQHGHHDGAQPFDRSVDGGAQDGFTRARNWLMYSSMMTPVCTATRIAPEAHPEETLKCVCVINSATNPPIAPSPRWPESNITHLKSWNMV